MGTLEKLVGGVVGMVEDGMAARAGTRAHGRWGEQPLCMEEELLLTFSSGTATPTAEAEEVRTLLARARGLAGAHFEVKREAIIPEAASQAAQDLAAARESAEVESAGTQTPEAGRTRPALTLRLHVPTPSGVVRGEHIKRVADRINDRRADLRHRDVVVTSAMPNWILSGAATGGAPHTGPGTLADLARPGRWPLAVPEGGRWPSGEGATGLKGPLVHVAVLDTAPRKEEFVLAVARHRDNRLLQDLSKEGVLTGWDIFPLSNEVPARPTNITADHGLFVAGVVHDIAPHARIHLLRVCDDQGLGHTARLIQALDHCLDLAHQGGRVVVNLSLYLLIPPGEDLWTYWFGPLSHRLSNTPGRMAELLDALDEAVLQRISLLLDAGAVVVAAAGNDTFQYGRAMQPRLPADYDNVLCVVATDNRGRLAAYSNRGDVPPTGNCIATYGGQGMRIGLNAVVPPGEPRDGVVGVYARHDVPTEVGPKQNDSGWAYWSGTSFATPMISGIAANLLARNEMDHRRDGRVPRLTPRGVMRQILALADPTADPALGCPYLPITQERDEVE